MFVYVSTFKCIRHPKWFKIATLFCICRIDAVDQKRWRKNVENLCLSLKKKYLLTDNHASGRIFSSFVGKLGAKKQAHERAIKPRWYVILFDATFMHSLVKPIREEREIGVICCARYLGKSLKKKTVVSLSIFFTKLD